MSTWRIAGHGDSLKTDGTRCWYVAKWRHGIAAKGEPAHVYDLVWFDSEDAMLARLAEFTSQVQP